MGNRAAELNERKIVEWNGPHSEPYWTSGDFERSKGRESSDLREFIATLRRGKWLIAGCALLIAAAAAGFAYTATPLYTAEGLLLLATPKAQITETKAVISDLPLETAMVRSEIEILKSPATAAKVTDALMLWNEPAFADTGPKLLPRLTAWALAQVGLGRREEAEGSPSPPRTRREQIAASVSGQLEAVFDGRSYVVKLRFTSTDPVLAARIVNAFMEINATQSLAAKTEATRRAKIWLQDRLDSLKTQLQAEDQAVERWRVEHKISEAHGLTVPAQQLSEINTQLIAARSERVQREANLREIQNLAARPDAVLTAGQVLNSPILQGLSHLETEVEKGIAEQSAVYGPRHPIITKLYAQREELRRKIKAEIDKVVRNASNEVAIARGREEELRHQLARAQGDTSVMGSAEVRLRELQRVADVTRRIYETFLSRVLEIERQEEVAIPDTRVISEAAVPLYPSYPRKTMLVGLAAAAGLMLGGFLALVTDRLKSGFTQCRSVERSTGLRLLGFVPNVARPQKALALLTEKPRSSFSEAIRSIRTSLNAIDPDGSRKVVLVTSSVPGEGKSLLAACLARSVAAGGRRTLLLDCDLRHASIGELLGDHSGAGLVEVVEGRASFEEVIRRDADSGMEYLRCHDRRYGGNPQDLLASAAMVRFLQRAKARYEFVVIDAPPILAVGDPKILARYADCTLFVIRWRRTPVEVVQNALDTLGEEASRVVGAVLSRVDVKKQAKLGFHDSASYHGRFPAYYR